MRLETPGRSVDGSSGHGAVNPRSVHNYQRLDDRELA